MADQTLKPTIARIWRGRTRPERAEEYQAYYFENGIKPLIETALGVQTLREDTDRYCEFVTVSHWEDFNAMARFTGGDPGRIHHLPRDPEFLIELPPWAGLHYRKSARVSFPDLLAANRGPDFGIGSPWRFMGWLMRYCRAAYIRSQGCRTSASSSSSGPAGRPR